MKKTFVSFIVVVSMLHYECNRPTCREDVLRQCWYKIYTYGTCTEGVYENIHITADTIMLNDCDSRLWIEDMRTANEKFMLEIKEIDPFAWQFYKEYPFDCRCD